MWSFGLSSRLPVSLVLIWLVEVTAKQHHFSRMPQARFPPTNPYLYMSTRNNEYMNKFRKRGMHECNIYEHHTQHSHKTKRYKPCGTPFSTRAPIVGNFVDENFQVFIPNVVKISVGGRGVLHVQYFPKHLLVLHHGGALLRQVVHVVAHVFKKTHQGLLEPDVVDVHGMRRVALVVYGWAGAGPNQLRKNNQRARNIEFATLRGGKIFCWTLQSSLTNVMGLRTRLKFSDVVGEMTSRWFNTCNFKPS